VVLLNDVTLRDGQQSLLATRMRTSDIVEVASLLDSAGFYALEVWGGATFDSALRFLSEDPWERLKAIRSVVKRSKLFMLLRGVNLVGYRPYPQDVVEKFVEYAHRDGVDMFRVFDALNSAKNLEPAVRAIKRTGAELQICLVYTESPVHTVEYYRKLAEDFLSRFEPDWITIKDMAGILDPFTAYSLVKELRSLGAKVNLHTHSTAGFSVATVLKAVEAGVDAVDVALSSLSLFTSHPPAETVIVMLRRGGYKVDVDLEAIVKASRAMWKIRQKYKEFDYALKNPPVDIDVLLHQIPGGMLSNLLAQLRELGAEDRLPEVLDEVKKVREEFGWPPLVTPISQIVGAQSVVNVVAGRYSILVKEARDYLLGKYGDPPAPPKKELVELAKQSSNSGQPEKVVDLKTAESSLPKEFVEKYEDYITYALFPDVALNFFKQRYSAKIARAASGGDAYYEL